MAPDKVPISASELRKRETVTIGARADPRRTFRTGKDCGIGHFPSFDFGINAAWLTASMTGQILLAWLKLLALDGDLAKAEPKTLRYRILHAAARLVHGGRRRRLKIQATWPWAAAITVAWQRIDALPQAP